MRIKKLRINWTATLIQVEADKYTTKSEWEKGSRNSYTAANRHDCADNYAAHMIVKQINWTPKLIQAEADKYTARGKWKKGSPNSYAASRRHGGINRYAKHMIAKYKSKV